MTISDATFNGVVGGDDLYKVVINSGEFSSEVPASYIAEGNASASLTSGETTKFYIGTSEEIAETLAGKVKEGDTIVVQQGDVTLSIPVGNVTVSNSGGGNVQVNGNPVTGEPVVTTQPSGGNTDSDDSDPVVPSYPMVPGETIDLSNPSENPQTGDSSNLLVSIVVLLMSAVTLAGAFLYRKVKA